MTAPTDIEIEHRRIDLDGFTADDDWATDRVFPVEGPELADGEARPIQALGNRVCVFVEACSGIADDSDPVTDAAVQVTLHVVTKYEIRGKVFACSGQAMTLGTQSRGVEVELPRLGKSFVRVTEVASAGEGTAALWIFVDDRMAP